MMKLKYLIAVYLTSLFLYGYLEANMVNGIPEWSPKGDKCLLRSVPNKVEIYDLNGQILWQRNEMIGQGKFSPDGTRFAYDRPGVGLYVYNFSTRQTALIEPTSAGEPVKINWTADSQTISYWRTHPSPNHIRSLPVELMAVNADGTNLRVVRETTWPLFDPHNPQTSSQQQQPEPEPTTSPTPSPSPSPY